MGSYRFHAHSIDEIDVACRLWGAQGVQQMLDGRTPRELAQAQHVLTAAQPSAAPGRRAGPRGWLTLLRLRPSLARGAGGERSAERSG